MSLVRGGILDESAFLEHGAHYAIGAITVIFMANTLDGVNVP